MNFRLEGIVPAMLTPFSEGGKSIDYKVARALAARLAGQGVQGLFPCGTTGEGPLLTTEERKKLIVEVIAEVGTRLKVIAHTGTFDTATTIDLTKHAADSGAAAAGVVAPGFFGYDDAALRAHFVAIAEANPGFPILVYNIPGCARNWLSPELVIDLAHSVDNIVGLKDSSGSMPKLNQILAGVPSDFNVINGVDEYAFQALVAGASGIVASTANVLPELFLSIYNSVKQGDLKKGWEEQKRLLSACDMFQYGAMVARYKEGLRLRGFDPGAVRPPQRELTEAERKTLREKWDRLKLA